LTSAGTYRSDETGFVDNPNTDGNGYARITLVSAQVTNITPVTKTATKWINIEEQIENGTFTGTFDYGNYIITETDTAGSETIHKK